MNIEDREKYKKIIILAVLLVAGCLMYVRNLFGFDWSDETFYPSGAYRLIIGDELFKDVFGVTQFGDALIAPIIYLYKMFVGSLDGIILFFRIVNNTINIIISLYVFYIFKDRCNHWLLLIPMVSIIVFTPGSIASVSYNTLSMQLLMISVLFIASYLHKSNNRYNKMKLIFSGLSYGFAVQMYPGLVIAIFIIPMYLLYDKKIYGVKESAFKRVTLWVVGGLIVVIIFMCFLMYNSSIENMITNFYRLFEIKNQSYSNRSISGADSIISICIQYLSQIMKVIGRSAYAVLGITAVTLIYSFISKLKNPFVDVALKFMVYSVFIWQYYYVIKAGYINYINIPLALMGVSLWSLLGRKSSVVVLLYVLGIFESFAIQIGSNNGIAGSSYGLFLSSIAVMIYFAIYYNNVKSDEEKCIYGKNIERVMAGIMCLCICCSMVYFRVDYVYRDYSITKLNSQLENGPGKGIYTTRESKDIYEGICKEIVQYIPEKGTVLFSKLLPFGYLMSELRPAYSTTYRVPINYEYLEGYYEEFPEKIPSCVFLINENVGITNEDNPVEGYLGDILLSGKYEIVKLKYSTVYINKQENFKE